MSSAGGNSRENEVATRWREMGWVVVCSRASLGEADLVALKAGERALMIQVKGDKGSPFSNFKPPERVALLEAAERAGAEALLVWHPRDRRGMRFLKPPDWPPVRAGV